ncbi:MAG: hypothetical protein HY550_01795 [Elusimicrobia bacterium]|nr:hypothetical protein [Elusimicrobiota bacterium]
MLDLRKFAGFILSLSVIALPALNGTAFASGACCSVSGGDPKRLSLTVVGASAMNHEAIGADTYELSQQALLLKLGKPVGRGFVLQAQVGLPAATELSHEQMELSGRGGLIYGAGVGYKLPRFLEPVDLTVSASFSRSLGYLDKDMAGTIDQSFRINEFQVLFIGETALSAKTALYAGLRAYSGKNQLKDNSTGAKVNGDQEGSLAALAGIRYNLAEKLSLVADAGFGHTRVIGIGAVFSF